jgi:hypothetical protein
MVLRTTSALKLPPPPHQSIRYLTFPYQTVRRSATALASGARAVDFKFGREPVHRLGFEIVSTILRSGRPRHQIPAPRLSASPCRSALRPRGQARRRPLQGLRQHFVCRLVVVHPSMSQRFARSIALYIAIDTSTHSRRSSFVPEGQQAACGNSVIVYFQPDDRSFNET